MALPDKTTQPNVVTTSPKAAGMILLAEERARRQRAAREELERPAQEADLVAVRVTHKGDGKVSMGEHVAGIGEAYYVKGETFDHPRHLAEELQDRGLVEIQD